MQISFGGWKRCWSYTVDLTTRKNPWSVLMSGPVQLVSETRVPLPPEPGKPERYDDEYKREGTCNLFTFFQPL